MMEKERRKELKAQYKETKTPMGILIIRPRDKKVCYLEAAQNLPGIINSARFKLNGGMFGKSSLQKAWTAEGEDSFIIEILDTLDYDKDELKTDYTEELKELKKIWEDKLISEGWQLY